MLFTILGGASQHISDQGVHTQTFEDSPRKQGNANARTKFSVVLMGWLQL